MKHRIFTTFFCLGVLTTAFGQLQKGDWMLDFSAGMNLGTSFAGGGEKAVFTASFSPSAGYFFTDRLMAGGGIGFYSGSAWSSNSGHFNLYNYNFLPFVRYYFLKKDRLMGFGFGEGFIQNRQNGLQPGDSTLFFLPEGWAYNLGAGIGANFFLAPNVALEAKAGMRLAQGSDYEIFTSDRDKLYISLGINTFLHQRMGEKYDLLDRYLRKGNSIVDGEAYLRSNNRKPVGSSAGTPESDRIKGYAFYLGPGFQQFITDRLLVGGGVGVARETSGDDINSFFRLRVNAEPYIPLAGRLFFVPAAELGWSHESYKGNSLEFKEFRTDTIGEINGVPVIGSVPVYDTVFTTLRSNVFSSALGLQLKYFTNSTAIFGGGLSAEYSTVYNERVKYDRLALGASVSYEQFFAENLSLSANLFFRLYDIIDSRVFDNGDRYGGVAFTLKYFIFNNKNRNSIR